ncbi:MAG TPA: type I pantothenate kinase [Gammaproteobacteria bacterium]|nr:type I pantothenate kinase [Gammaproteobacteria bacterium]
MSQLHSPYLQFSRQAWQQFRQDTPLTLSEADLEELKGQNEPISLQEVIEIYLPLSRLLNLYVAATQDLYKVTTRFLGHPEPKVPYLIGIAGSVAVGKSTTSRILRALLSRWPNHPHVVLVTTDGFIYSTATLEKHNLLNRKGFPESYNLRALISFLADLKAGKANLNVPVYSHHHYDIIPNTFQVVDRPDIVIVEGLNVLQVPQLRKTSQSQWFVSDFFDFTIYVDADTQVIKQWYKDRFMTFRAKARDDKEAFFYQFAQWDESEALAFCDKIWTEINERNLHENILPIKRRARLILEKASDHSVQKVYLRKL